MRQEKEKGEREGQQPSEEQPGEMRAQEGLERQRARAEAWPIFRSAGAGVCTSAGAGGSGQAEGTAVRAEPRQSTGCGDIAAGAVSARSAPAAPRSSHGKVFAVFEKNKVFPVFQAGHARHVEARLAVSDSAATSPSDESAAGSHAKWQAQGQGGKPGGAGPRVSKGRSGGGGSSFFRGRRRERPACPWWRLVCDTPGFVVDDFKSAPPRGSVSFFLSRFLG